MQKIIRSFSGRRRCAAQGLLHRTAPARLQARGAAWRIGPWLLGPCLAVLSACGEDETPARKPAVAVESVPGAPAQARPSQARPSHERPAPANPSQSRPTRDWLERADAVPPEVWLAAHTTPPADAARLAALLKEADVLFDETPRMLANRTAQLQRMLAEAAMAEAPQDLLEGFIRVARTGGRADAQTLGRQRPGRLGFGDLCQHYFNLRAQGLSHAAALEALALAGQGRPTP